jgi:hypothetical protein
MWFIIFRIVYSHRNFTLRISLPYPFFSPFIEGTHIHESGQNHYTKRYFSYKLYNIWIFLPFSYWSARIQINIFINNVFPFCIKGSNFSNIFYNNDFTNQNIWTIGHNQKLGNKTYTSNLIIQKVVLGNHYLMVFYKWDNYFYSSICKYKST